MSTIKNKKPGTSLYEQAIYFYVKRFFNDAENRYPYIDSNGEIIEADILIPSIKIVIEYDGKYWHTGSKKVDRDNYKNEHFNNLGFYVIRVRDVGLPELKPFRGRVLFHGSRHDGMHTNEFVEEIIHILADWVNDSVKHDDLFSFNLSYKDYLDDIAKIAAPLYIHKISDNFAKYSAYQYWDKEKNGSLDPESISPTDNVQAWFICPNGKPIVRPISWVYTPSNSETEIKSIRNICPFMPLEQLNMCGKDCAYVEPWLTQMTIDFLLDKHKGNNEYTIDEIDYYLRLYPRTAFIAIKTMIEGNEATKERFAEYFLTKNTKHTLYYKVEYVRLLDLEEFDYLEELYRVYPTLLTIPVDWRVFDTNKETIYIFFERINRIEKLKKEYYYNKKSFFTRKNKDSYVAEDTIEDFIIGSLYSIDERPSKDFCEVIFSQVDIDSFQKHHNIGPLRKQFIEWCNDGIGDRQCYH